MAGPGRTLREWAGSGSYAPRRNAMLLVDYALEQPIFTVRQVQRHLAVTYARANGLVSQLVGAGVLRQYNQAVYDREFTAPDVLAVILRSA